MRILEKRMVWILCLFMVFSVTGVAQHDEECDECKKKKERIELDLESALELIPDLGIFTGSSMKELTKEASRLGELLDLEAWEEEVSDLVDLSAKETKRVEKLLKAFHEHYAGDSVCIKTGEDKADEWFKDLLDLVEDRFDRDTARPLSRWMVKKKKAIDKCAEKLEKLGTEVGESAGEWAELYADDIAESTKDIQVWAEKYGKNWEKWADEHGKDWEKWGNKFGKRMEAWGKTFGKDMEKWGKTYGKDMEIWGDKLSKDLQIHLDTAFNLDSLKKLSELSEICVVGAEGMEDQIADIVQSAISGVEWEALGEQINAIVAESVGDVKTIHLDNEEMRENIEEFAREISEAVEEIHSGLDKKRVTLKKEYSANWNDLVEALEAAGIGLEAGLAGLEGLEDLDEMIVIGGSKDKEKLKNALKEKALLKKKEAIKSRDVELDSLKKEIKKLKREMLRMKKEQKELEELREELDV